MPLCTARFFGKILPLGDGDFSTKTGCLTLQCRKAANYFCSKKVVRNETEGEYQVEVLEL